jgi:hypothetical protein
MSQIYASDYGDLVSEYGNLPQDLKEVFPDVLPHCGIEYDQYILIKLVLIMAEDFDQDKLLNLRIIIAVW